MMKKVESIKTRKKSLYRCASCSAKPVVGSLCIHCFVGRYIRKYKIHRSKEFINLQPRFEAMLLGRFNAIKEGFDPPSADLIFKLFHKGGGTYYLMKTGALYYAPPRYPAEKKIRKLISLLDEAAKRERLNESTIVSDCDSEG